VSDELAPREPQQLTKQQAELALMAYIVDPDTRPEDADALLVRLREQYRARQNDT
jgi:hypothetical protein